MKSWDELLSFFDSRELFHIQLGLDRIVAACEQCGHPETSYPIIHIAGTNGKGSTAAFIESILRHSGYSVGLYTSPHLVDIRERIQINREWVAQSDWIAVLDRVAPLIESLALSYFEAMTLVAYLLFKEKKVDWVVLETGLGGRLDATNHGRPELSVLTQIGMDHTKWLGESLEEIAREKCGIIKHGVPVVTTDSQPAIVRRVIESEAARHQAPLYWAPPISDDKVGLAGDHQRDNAGIARKVAEVLIAQGVPLACVDDALASTSWAGRLEVVSDHPMMIVDGAHNEDGALALARYLSQPMFDEAIIVFGGMADKSLDTMMATLDNGRRTWVLTRGENPRYADPKVLAKAIFGRSHVSETIPEALDLARQLCKGAPIVVTGSLYLIGEVKQCLR